MGVVGDVVGVSHDVEVSAVGVLGDLVGDGLQLGISRCREVVGVGIEGDIAGQGDRDVLVGGARTGRVIQSPGVALQGHHGGLVTGATIVLDDLVGLAQGFGADPDIGGGVAVDDTHADKTGLRDEHGDLVKVDRCEHHGGGDRLTGLELKSSSGRRSGGPHPTRAGSVDQPHTAGATSRKRSTQRGAGVDRVVTVVRTALGALDIGDRRVVRCPGEFQDQGRSLLTDTHQGRYPHRDAVPQQMTIQVLPPIWCRRSRTRRPSTTTARDTTTAPRPGPGQTTPRHHRHARGGQGGQGQEGASAALLGMEGQWSWFRGHDGPPFSEA